MAAPPVPPPSMAPYTMGDLSSYPIGFVPLIPFVSPFPISCKAPVSHFICLTLITPSRERGRYRFAMRLLPGLPRTDRKSHLPHNQVSYDSVCLVYLSVTLVSFTSYSRSPSESSGVQPHTLSTIAQECPSTFPPSLHYPVARGPPPPEAPVIHSYRQTVIAY